MAEPTTPAGRSSLEVERAFRSMKSFDLKLLPIHHYLAYRVRAHILICMLVY